MAVAAVAFTIVTGGAGAVAAGFAIAGAVVAVTSLVMSETGATDKLIKAIADSLEKSGMSKSGAQIAAALIVNLSIMAVSLGCSIGGMVAGLAQVGKAVALCCPYEVSSRVLDHGCAKELECHRDLRKCNAKRRQQKAYKVRPEVCGGGCVPACSEDVEAFREEQDKHHGQRERRYREKYVSCRGKSFVR
jgi:hypothetical protein